VAKKLKGEVNPLQCCSGCSGLLGIETGIPTTLGIVKIMVDNHKHSRNKNYFVDKIEAYQKTIDPKLKKALGVKRICRYTPTCSQYGKAAIKKHGSAKGIALTAWRIMRCNPFSKGGRDPVR